MNNTERIAEIRERCTAATPGPWQVWGDGSTIWQKEEPKCTIAYHADGRDAQFIAHAREDIPYLLSEIEALTAELEQKTRELERSVKLPCDIGDTVYEVFNRKIQPFCVIGFRRGVMMSEYDDCEEIDCEEWCIEYSCGGMSCSTYFSAIGKTVFLTHAEAEAALFGPCHGCKHGDDRFDNPCSCPTPCKNHDQYEAVLSAEGD